MARIIGIIGSDENGDNGEEITDLDHLVGMVSGSCKSESSEMEKAFSLRLPISLAARIKAMASHGEVSQNEFLKNLMEFAVSEVYDRLDSKVQKALNKQVVILLDEFKDGGAA